MNKKEYSGSVPMRNVPLHREDKKRIHLRHRLMCNTWLQLINTPNNLNIHPNPGKNWERLNLPLCPLTHYVWNVHCCLNLFGVLLVHIMQHVTIPSDLTGASQTASLMAMLRMVKLFGQGGTAGLGVHRVEACLEIAGIRRIWKNRLVGGEHDFFLYIGNNNPNLTFIFFRGIETTNQVSVLGVRLLKGLDILLSLGIIKIFTEFHMCILIFRGGVVLSHRQ